MEPAEVFCVYIPQTQLIYILVLSSDKDPIVILGNSPHSTIFKVYVTPEEMEPIFDFCLKFAKHYKEVLPGSEYATLVPERVKRGRIELTGHYMIDSVIQAVAQVIADPTTARSSLENRLATELLTRVNATPN